MSQNITILIVDDDADGQQLLERLLARLNCNLAFASSGLEALEKASELVPDLILLDVMMPGMNGFQVCERLRADPVLADVPIVMLTALDDRESRLKGIGAGADDFLSKPFDSAELKTRVQTITRLNRYRRLLVERTKFEWVVDQAEDGYLMLDKKGNILYANPKARLYLGLPLERSSFFDQNFLQQATEQYRCEPDAAWTTWPDPPQDNAIRYLVRPETPASYAFWLQVTMLDLPAGPETGTVIRLQDITQQVHLQREMQSFHAMVSHKLRTPLVGIYSGLELVIEFADKSSNREIIEVAEIALNNVQRLRAQIDDIVEYIYTPNLTDTETTFDLTDLPRTVTKLCADLELESVTVAGHQELTSTRVLFSQQTIEVMLWEILENSKKFHPQQAPSVEIAVLIVNAKQVSLRISDDGLHLSPEQLDQVLTPYYQGDKYFTGEVTGMGLGLSMIAMVMWAAGGMCRIYNRKDGPGVVVELLLPLAEETGSA